MARESESPTDSRWIDTEQAADILGLSLDQVRELIRSGELKGCKVDKVWLVEMPQHGIQLRWLTRIQRCLSQYKPVVAGIAALIIFLIAVATFVMQLRDDPVNLSLETRDVDSTSIQISVCRRSEDGILTIRQKTDGLLIVNSNSIRTVSIVSATYTYDHGREIEMKVAANPGAIGETMSFAPLPIAVEPGSRFVALRGEILWSIQGGSDEVTLDAMRNDTFGAEGTWTLAFSNGDSRTLTTNQKVIYVEIETPLPSCQLFNDLYK